MRKQTLAASFLSIFVLIALFNHGNVATAGGFDWSSVPETQVVDNDTQTNASDQKSGNSFARALSSPFRALGRLFGGGKKKDSQQARSTTEKDAKKFESAKVIRIRDANTPSETSSQAASPQQATTVNGPFERGRDLLANGDVNDAIAELSAAASIDPKSGAAKNLLGVAYEAKGLRDRALESFKAAVHADKNNAEYLNNYGFLLFKNNDFEEASKYLKRAAKAAPDNPRIWNNLGLAQCRRGKFDDAFESFSRAGGEFNGHLNVASQLLAHGLAKDAINHLEKAQKMQPTSTEVLAKLVDLYKLTGRITDAATAQRSIIALQTSANANK